jgi:hypothetical protein
MTTKAVTLTGCLAVAMAGLPALSLAATNPVAIQLDGGVVHKQVFQAVKDLSAKACDAADHAAALQSIARNASSDWQVHLSQLDALKDDINAMGRNLYDLEQIRDSAAPLEREAIDRAAPLLKLMADNTEAAIQFLNDNHGNFWLASYQKYVDNLTAGSEQLSNSLGKTIQLAKVRAKERHLEKALSVESGY